MALVDVPSGADQPHYGITTRVVTRARGIWDKENVKVLRHFLKKVLAY